MLEELTLGFLKKTLSEFVVLEWDMYVNVLYYVHLISLAIQKFCQTYVICRGDHH